VYRLYWSGLRGATNDSTRTGCRFGPGWLAFAKMATGYPISTVSYAIVCSKYKDAAKGSLVKAFLSYAVGKGQAVADGLGYAPLPTELASKDAASLSAIA